ncbi:hypothetical protein [Bdellovibrio bacteriovorus]|uniref:hypothetical protein n=1 Tax=Bdellovibrio TaxID=958 RepID=UPI0035A83638
MRQLILTALIVAVGACSFKKEPAKPTPEVIVVEKSTTLQNDPEFVLLNQQEDTFINSLEDKTVPFLENIRSKSNETLIDLTIKTKKKKTLEYLLARGFNPLLYGKNSIESLSKNAEYRGLLNSFQKPLFYKLFTKLGNLIDEDKLDEEFKRMNMQGPSCQDLVNLILDGYFFESTTSDSYMVVKLEEYFVPDALKAIFKTKSCEPLKTSFSSTEISRWIANELLLQVNNRFTSTDLAEFLLSLGTVENLSIDGYRDGRKVKVDPRLLTFLNGNTLIAEGEHRNDWFLLMNKLVSKDLHFYNMKYKTAEEIKASGEECDTFEDEYCLNIYDNREALITTASIFGLENPHKEKVDQEDEKESNNEAP